MIEFPTFYFGLLSRLANKPSFITSMILLTTIDRYMSTRNEVHYRALSQLKIAYRIIPIIIIILSMILSSHMLIFFEFYPSYIAQLEVYLILWVVISPSRSILFFSLLTFRNVMRTKRRITLIMPTVIKQQGRI